MDGRHTTGATDGAKVVVDRYIRVLDGELRLVDQHRDALERAFIAIAGDFSIRNRISVETWRDVGVSVDVLARAGLVLSQGPAEPSDQVRLHQSRRHHRRRIVCRRPDEW